MRTSVSRSLAIASAAVLTAASSAEVGFGGDFEAGLALVPSDALAAVVIPNMKFTSDEISRCLEGMDRANLLLGSRPLDQWKSAMGFNTALHDTGPAAIALLAPPAPLDAVPDARALVPLFILPVNNPDDFLRSNFTPADAAGALRTADGRTVWAKHLPARNADGTSHVVLGEVRQSVEQYAPSDAWLKLLRHHAGQRGQQVIHQGELVFLSCRPGLQLLLSRLAHEQARQVQLRAAGLAQNQADLLRDASERWSSARQMHYQDAPFALFNVDFDPLAVVVRHLAGFDPASQSGAATAGGEDAGDGLQLLPRKPYFFAGQLDLLGLGRSAWLEHLAGAAHVSLPECLNLCDAISCSAMPVTDGLSAGLLSNAALLFRTQRPAELLAEIKSAMSSVSPGAAAPQITWEHRKNINAVEDLQAFSIQYPPNAQADQHALMTRQVLFGGPEIKGFAKEMPGMVLLTFSQNPALISSALDVLNTSPALPSGDGSAPPIASQSLSADGVIKTMRKWMPPNPDAELYISIGRLASHLGPLMQALMGAPLGMSFNQHAPPVGLALEVQDSQEHAVAVFPNAVLVTFVDRFISSLLQPRLDPPANGAAAAPQSPATAGAAP